MGLLGLAVGVMLPWLLGLVWLRVLWRERDVRAWPVWLGYGYVLGALVTTLVMRLLDVLGITFSFVSISLPLLGITIAGALLYIKTPALTHSHPYPPPSREREVLLRWQQLLFIFLFAIII